MAGGSYARLIGHDRAHEGRQTGVTDGPFAETKEQLGGYHLVECHNLDEALSIAARIPTLPAGGAIEVRPLEPSLESEISVSR